MFIRKRTYKLKSGRITESYQVIETYRENGKIKQKMIINLNRFSDPEKALEYAQMRLEWAKRIYEKPILSSRLRTTKNFTRKEHKQRIIRERLEQVQKFEKWVKELGEVVSRLFRQRHNYDTT